MKKISKKQKEETEAMKRFHEDKAKVLNLLNQLAAERDKEVGTGWREQ